MPEKTRPSGRDFFKGRHIVEARDVLGQAAEGLETNSLKVAETKTGQGLVAKQEIKANQPIFCIDGQIIEQSPEVEGKYFTEGSIKGMRTLDYNPDATYPNAICVGQKQNVNSWLNPNPDNPLRYLNHSCQPNATRKGPYMIWPLREIHPGEEITIDYSTLEINPRWQMACQCGSEDCRGNIGSVHSLPLDLVERYWQDFPDFMRQSYLEHAKQTFTTPEDLARVRVLNETSDQGFKSF